MNFGSKKPLELKKITSSRLKVNFDIKEDNELLVLTVPYDKNWKIKIDGKNREAIKIFNAFMAIPVSKGDKVLEMRYEPKGYKIGLILSLFSLFLIIGNFCLNIFTKRKKYLC